MMKEREYITKIRNKSHLSEKFYKQAIKDGGAASIRWQDSVKRFKSKFNYD